MQQQTRVCVGAAIEGEECSGGGVCDDRLQVHKQQQQQSTTIISDKQKYQYNQLFADCSRNNNVVDAEPAEAAQRKDEALAPYRRIRGMILQLSHTSDCHSYLLIEQGLRKKQHRDSNRQSNALVQLNKGQFVSPFCSEIDSHPSISHHQRL